MNVDGVDVIAYFSVYGTEYFLGSIQSLNLLRNYSCFMDEKDSLLCSEQAPKLRLLRMK